MITYPTYQKHSGNGANWICHCVENGNSRLVFFGDTEDEAIKAAKSFATKSLDSPERRSRIKSLAEARAKASAAKKAKAA